MRLSYEKSVLEDKKSHMMELRDNITAMNLEINLL
jgi:hypothetical protein